MATLDEIRQDITRLDQELLALLVADDDAPDVSVGDELLDGGHRFAARHDLGRLAAARVWPMGAW